MPPTVASGLLARAGQRRCRSGCRSRLPGHRLLGCAQAQTQIRSVSRALRCDSRTPPPPCHLRGAQVADQALAAATEPLLDDGQEGRSRPGRRRNAMPPAVVSRPASRVAHPDGRPELSILNGRRSAVGLASCPAAIASSAVLRLRAFVGCVGGALSLGRNTLLACFPGHLQQSSGVAWRQANVLTLWHRPAKKKQIRKSAGTQSRRRHKAHRGVQLHST